MRPAIVLDEVWKKAATSGLSAIVPANALPSTQPAQAVVRH